MSFDRDAIAKKDAYLKVLHDRLRRYPFVQIVMRLRAPSEPLEFPSDQTLLICQIAVPPQDHGEDDELHVIIGERIAYSSRVKYLIDSYPLALAQAHDDGTRSSEQVHEELWKRRHLGVEVALAVPPRQSYRLVTKVMREPVRGLGRLGTDAGCPLDVYLGCYFSRDVC